MNEHPFEYDHVKAFISRPDYVHVTKRDDNYHYICNQCMSWRDMRVLVNKFVCKHCDNVNDKIFLVSITKPSKPVSPQCEKKEQ